MGYLMQMRQFRSSRAFISVAKSFFFQCGLNTVDVNNIRETSEYQFTLHLFAASSDIEQFPFEIPVPYCMAETQSMFYFEHFNLTDKKHTFCYSG